MLYNKMRRSRGRRPREDRLSTGAWGPFLYGAGSGADAGVDFRFVKTGGTPSPEPTRIIKGARGPRGLGRFAIHPLVLAVSLRKNR